MTSSVTTNELTKCEEKGGEGSALLFACQVLLKVLVASLGGLIGVVAGFVIGISTGLIPFSC